MSRPVIVITFPFECRPQVTVNFDGVPERMLDWLDTHPEYLDLVAAALALADDDADDERILDRAQERLDLARLALSVGDDAFARRLLVEVEHDFALVRARMDGGPGRSGAL